MTAVLTRNVVDGRGVALDRAAYEARGGYQGLRRALKLGPQAVLKAVEDSGLRGRGGAGFPTGKKWAFVAGGEPARTRYLVCNCDEMEPGSFKDRLLLYEDPHQLLEGVLIAAFALGAREAYVFIRREYADGADRFRRAVDQARQVGYVGREANGSGVDVEVHVHVSAGRYICGEETALLNALEGRRANPRARPPYPAVAGLFGLPTVVNNVETLCCLPHIVEHGAEWFRKLGRSGGAGTKLYTVSGRVKRPGTYELPIGTTLREVIDEHCGGMREGYRWQAVVPGGGSTPLMSPDQADTPMDFAAMEAAGTRLGTGGIIVIDDRTCIVGAVKNLEHFYAQESCGWCTPCREGLPYVEWLLQEFEDGRGTRAYLDELVSLPPHIGPTSFCAHAMGAMGPLESSLAKFRDVYEAHVGRGCAWRS